MLGTTCDPVSAESRGEWTTGPRPVRLHNKIWAQKKKAKPERKYFSSNLRAKVVRLTLGIIISEIL